MFRHMCKSITKQWYQRSIHMAWCLCACIACRISSGWCIVLLPWMYFRLFVSFVTRWRRMFLWSVCSSTFPSSFIVNQDLNFLKETKYLPWEAFQPLFSGLPQSSLKWRSSSLGGESPSSRLTWLADYTSPTDDDVLHRHWVLVGFFWWLLLPSPHG